MRKLAVAAALALVVLAGIAGYIYLQRDSLLESAIEDYGSDILGAKVLVDGVKLSPIDGEGTVHGLSMGSPKGFRRDVAHVGAIELALDPKTIADDVVRIRRIVVLTPRITYEQRAEGTNLQALQRNAARYIGATSTKERQAGTKFMVDRLVIRGGQLTYIPVSAAADAGVAVRLPDITLSHIGKGRGGVTAAELATIIVDALMARTTTAVGERVLEQTVERLFSR